MLISAIVPSRNRNGSLIRLLGALGGQELEPGVTLEVLVALDGTPADPAVEAAANRSRHPVRLLELHQVGISRAKNEAIRSARGDTLLFLNDDVVPAPTFVAEHARAQAAAQGRHAVLGWTGWQAHPDATWLDAMIAQTPMIFFYEGMEDGRLYPFRYAWNLNLSLPRRLFDVAGGFSEAFRPCMYEDLELAWRLAALGCEVKYHAAAAALHEHRYTWEAYLRREVLLGLMAPVLARVNPECFLAIFRQDVAALAASARRAQDIDRRDDRRIHDWLAELVAQPRTPAAGAASNLQTLYQLHLPVKRRAFRFGLLQAVDGGVSDAPAIDHAARTAVLPDCLFTIEEPALPSLRPAA